MKVSRYYVLVNEVGDKFKTELTDRLTKAGMFGHDGMGGSKN